MTFDSGAAAPAVAHDQTQHRYLTIFSQILCVLIPVAIWFMPIDVEPTTKHGLAIAMLMVVAWITRVMDYTVTGLIGCFLFWVLGVVRFRSRFPASLMILRGSYSRRSCSESSRRAPA
jgi:di/tricarboxylate transporter